MTVRDAVIVDGGGANLASLRFALDRLGCDAPLCADPDRIRSASHVLLPGVGAAAAGMSRLRDQGLDTVIPALTQPVLGICLGMQLLFEHSEEDDTACLGIMRGSVRKLEPRDGLRVPHMGWNRIRLTKADPILRDCPDQSYCYFVHSYAADIDDEQTLAESEHGRRFAAIVRRGNFAGTQFHPERSGSPGAAILKSFLDQS